jgi:hypothetical protein
MIRNFINALNPLISLAVVDKTGVGGMAAESVSEAEALRSEDERYGAQTAGDFDAMDMMFGEDLVYFHSTGAIDSKKTFIDSQRSGAVRYRKMNRFDEKVRTFGNVAIVSGRARFEVTAGGEDRIVDLLFHSIWIKRSGRLQFISWQATSLPSG